MRAVIVALVITFSLSPVADQCDQPTFAKANPGLCYPGPLGRLPGSGGPPDGGIIGAITRALHGLTGGIL
jgi:hypothetical protein